MATATRPLRAGAAAQYRPGMRRWLIEGALAVVALLLGSFFLATTLSEGDAWPLWAELAADLVAIAGLVLFRRS
nr:hypothetical protein GCM10020092_024780 [Actinoplanes digitatis]